MEAYFQEVAEKQRQQQQLAGGFDFASFSHLAQAAANTNPTAAAVGKQAVLAAGIAQDYFDDQRWKDNRQSAMMQCGPSHVLYNSNNNTSHGLAGVQQGSNGDFDMIAAAQAVATRNFAAGMQQQVAMMQQDSQTLKSEAVEQVILQNDGLSPFASTHERQVMSQHQELDSQEEQVIMSNEVEEENFNSQIVLAFLWIEAKLCAKLKTLTFCERVAYMYNPLEYASAPHAHYVSKYCGTKSVLFLGMNPGPYGMAQNGVPFGDTRYVREWLKISGEVHHPVNEHPRRPIQGLECTRSEVSGARFWGFIAKICGSPENFFQKSFVHNYCPLVLMTKTGKNIIPAALPAVDRRALEAVCDAALLQCIRVLRCQVVVAVGKYASDRVMHVLRVSGDESSASIRVERILHPSPASPQANSGWEEIVTRQLQESGVLQYLQSPA